MKEYKVTITETLKKEVVIEAESETDAVQQVNDAWYGGEYILAAENFVGVDFSAEDMIPKVEMTYAELSSLFSTVNDKKLPPIDGFIVFTPGSFDVPYNLESRTYVVSSNNKAYQADMGGYSIYASCLDGTDPCVRLEGYMRGTNSWKIEKCYMIKEDYDKLMNQLEHEPKSPKGREAR